MGPTPTPGPAEDSPLRWQSSQPVEHLTWAIQRREAVSPRTVALTPLGATLAPGVSSVSPRSRQHVLRAVGDPGVPPHCRLGTSSGDA